MIADYRLYPTRCNVTQFILSGNCSTCVGWYHPTHVEQFPGKTKCGTLHLVGYILEELVLDLVVWLARVSFFKKKKGFLHVFHESTFTYIDVMGLYGHWPRNESGSLRHESNGLPPLITRTCHWIFPHTFKTFMGVATGAVLHAFVKHRRKVSITLGQ